MLFLALRDNLENEPKTATAKGFYDQRKQLVEIHFRHFTSRHLPIVLPAIYPGKKK